MIEIKYAKSWLDRRRFYEFSHRLYRGNALWEEPSAWGGRSVLDPARNELMRFPHALLTAVEEGDILARMLVGLSGDEGFFTLFDARPRAEAVCALMEEASEWLKRRGAASITGPVAPIPADLGGGVLAEGFSEKPALHDAFNAPYYGELLEQCGMRPQSEWLSYRVDLDRFEWTKYRAIADYTEKRFDLTVRTDCAGRPRMLAKIMSRMLDGNSNEESVNRLVGRLLPELAEDMCPVVLSGETPAGWLLTLGKKKGSLRAATLWVDEEWRRKGITAILFRAAAESAKRRGIACVNASLIRIDNMASRLGIERAGGYVTHRHIQYSRQI